MAKVSIVKGTTSYLARIFVQDSSSTTGAGLTGLAYNSSGLVCYRARDDDGNAGGTAISLASATKGTWTSGGFVEKDATNMPGVYEFGIPNAALASGSKSVLILFKGATNMAPCPLEIELTAWDNQDAVRGGLTALPNANAEAAGGLYTRGTGAGQINQPANGMIDINAVRHLGTAYPTPNTAGVPLVDPRDYARVNTAAAGASTSITLDASATTTADFYKGQWVTILSGTGAGQRRFITAYSTGRVATVNRAWATNPDSSSVFVIHSLAEADLETWLFSAPNALQSGRVDSIIGAVTAGVIADVATAVWGAATRILTAGTNIALAKGTGVTGFNDLDAAGVRGAVGLGSPNLDTQIATLATAQQLPANVIAQAHATGGTINTVIYQVSQNFVLPADFCKDCILEIRFGGGTYSGYSDFRRVTGASITGQNVTLTVTGDFSQSPSLFHADYFWVYGLLGLTAADVTTAVPTAVQNADALLDRDMSTGTDSGSSSVRTPRNALRALRNKVSVSGGTVTVTKEDDSTTAWQAALTTDAAALPITGSDPT